MVIVLMKSAKMATLGLLVYKNYDARIPIYEVTNKTLSRDSNYIVNVVMWPNAGNSSIYFYERSYYNLNFVRIWPEKLFFWEVVFVQVQVQ